MCGWEFLVMLRSLLMPLSDWLKEEAFISEHNLKPGS